MTLKERIIESKTTEELNSLRLLLVQDISNFKENQKAFIKRQNQFRRIPLSRRDDNFKVYAPEVKQQER